MQRSRTFYAGLIGVVIVVGLSSRSRMVDHLPGFIGTYAGDTLWALMVFLLVGFLLPRQGTSVVAMVAMGIAVMVEVSQLYQGDWMNEIRATRLGALVLGKGFLWSDLVCYAGGVLMGVGGEVLDARWRWRAKRDR